MISDEAKKELEQAIIEICRKYDLSIMVNMNIDMDRYRETGSLLSVVEGITHPGHVYYCNFKDAKVITSDKNILEKIKEIRLTLDILENETRTYL
jgi:hypothetical protein